MDDPEERRVLHAAIDSFRQYRQAAHFNVTHVRRQSFYSLPSAHIDLLCERPFCLPDTFRLVDDAIDCNAEIADAIVTVGLPAFGIEGEEWKGKATPNDIDKARSTIRQIYRDWTAEGQAERNACFTQIVDGLAKHLSASERPHKVLVPGAGLGRLVFDLCLAGYNVEGNEISYHQLLASNYLLNYTEAAGQHKLFPWALSFSNHLSRANQLQSVSVPDVHPGQTLAGASNDFAERMSMSAGDFCVVYRQPENLETFDAVTTCFFIDTASNLIHYIEAVHACLRPDGIWVNLGPLLWHFENSAGKKEAKDTSTEFRGIGDPGSFELSHDEVLLLLQRFGFRIEEQDEMPGGASGYIQDPRSMLQHIYKPQYWVARKI